MKTINRSIWIIAASILIMGCLALIEKTPVFSADEQWLLSSATATIAPTSEPTPPACGTKPGEITDVEIPLKKDKPPLAVKIYTPPCFGSIPDQRYPLLMLLHGQSSTTDRWIELGVPTILDEMYQKEPGTAVIAVFPQEQNSHGDQDDSPYESQLVDTLIPWLRSNYPLSTEPTDNAVGGISRGGGWAFRLGIDHPEIFGSVGGHSPAIDGRDYFKLTDFRRTYKNDQIPRIYLDIGFDDSLKDAARKVELRLGELRIPHEWHMNSGTHNQDYWAAHIREYLDWYADSWRD